jgi:hypothetical protein
VLTLVEPKEIFGRKLPVGVNELDKKTVNKKVSY